MKAIGFFVDNGTLVSPTVFRNMAINPIKKLNLGKIQLPTVKDRYDIINFSVKKQFTKV